MTTDRHIVLITGATSGIGYETAYALTATSPQRHVIIGARDISKGQKCLQELQSRNPQGTLSVVELDIADDSTISSATAQITNEFGHLDVLVNNAGIAANQEEVDREILRKVFETNVFGTMLLSNALMPLLKESAHPKIVNVSSVMGSVAMKLDTSVPFHQVGVEVYRMSKAAVNMLSAHQQTVMKEFGGLAFSYCPGRVATNLDGGADLSEEERRNAGMDTPEFSAKGLAEVVEGKRDSEVGKFIASRNLQHPW